MPFIVPFIPLIAAGATAATSIYSTRAAGEQQDNAMQQQKQLAAEQAEKSRQQEESMKSQLFKRVAPDAQAAVGGSLTPDSFSQMVASMSGQPGDMDLAQKTLFQQPDTGGSLTGGGSGGGGGLQDIMQLLQGQGQGDGQDGFSLTGG